MTGFCACALAVLRRKPASNVEIPAWTVRIICAVIVSGAVHPALIVPDSIRRSTMKILPSPALEKRRYLFSTASMIVVKNKQNFK